MGDCPHKEKIEKLFSNLSIGKCSLCGRVAAYDPEGIRERVILIPGNKERMKYMLEQTDRSRPQNWDRMTRIEKSQWYEAHKDDIVTDYLKHGHKKTCTLWNINPNVLSKKVKQWEIPHRGYQGPKKDPPSPGSPPGDPPGNPDGSVMKFPEFNEKWDPTVQVAWLTAYATMATGGK